MDVTYGSDVVVDLIRRLGITHVAVNPGASFRGLHDSLSRAGSPEMVLTTHEGVAVAVAHGYAKAAGRPMAAALHNLVGLQHASMAVFNAFADHSPILLLGGSGPADHARRRPWIDWVHTAHQQALIVRDSVKWDAQPTSIEAMPDIMRRAHQIAVHQPAGPTYVALDSLLQETETDGVDLAGWGPSPMSPLSAPSDRLEAIADLLVGSDHPVIVADNVGRSRAGFDALRRLVEALAAPVIDLAARHNIPTNHWADCTVEYEHRVAEADAILALDCRDTRWALSRTNHHGRSHEMLPRPDAQVAVITLNDLKHSGFLDLEPVVRADEHVVADTAVALPALADLVDERVADAQTRISRRRDWLTEHTAALHAEDRRQAAAPGADGGISEGELCAEVFEAVREGPWQVGFNSFRGWPRRTWDMIDFNCHLGGSGGAGLGYGLGASMGAALAHPNDDTIVVDLQPDGDLLYTASGLWTAAHHQLPVLVVVVNNRSYGADWLHQMRMLDQRGGDPELAEHAIHLTGPTVDHAMLARAQGVEGFGPVTRREDLAPTLVRAAAVVRGQRRPVLVDVVVELPGRSGI